jgi:hypothetical protein
MCKASKHVCRERERAREGSALGQCAYPEERHERLRRWGQCGDSPAMLAHFPTGAESSVAHQASQSSSGHFGPWLNGIKLSPKQSQNREVVEL